MHNFWLELSSTMIEKEVILVKNNSENKYWYDKMPTMLPAIYPEKKKLSCINDFQPQVGMAHHLRLTRFGIEGVLKLPRRFHRLLFYVLHDNQYEQPFWVVLHK